MVLSLPLFLPLSPSPLLLSSPLSFPPSSSPLPSLRGVKHHAPKAPTRSTSLTSKIMSRDALIYLAGLKEHTTGGPASNRFV